MNKQIKRIKSIFPLNPLPSQVLSNFLEEDYVYHGINEAEAEANNCLNLVTNNH